VPSPLDTLTEINLDDLVTSFGWQDEPLLASALRRIFAGPARKFAQQMADFDNSLGANDLAQASRRIMRTNYVRDVRVHGREHVPASGPALFLSNHPGIADTISLFAAINRADLKIIAVHRPFLAALENTAKSLFFIDDDPARRMNAVRQVSSHLKNGGAALTFPAGEIEPDPDVYDGALDSLESWTDSAAVFVRFAPAVKIVPVLVSGVIWEGAARHPLTRLKRARVDRERLAAALQLLAMVVWNARPNRVHVHFASPVTLDEVGSTDAKAIHQVVIERMRDLIQNRRNDDGSSVLHDAAK
jgi:putative hemolysin